MKKICTFITLIVLLWTAQAQAETLTISGPILDTPTYSWKGSGLQILAHMRLAPQGPDGHTLFCLEPSRLYRHAGSPRRFG